MGRFHGFGGIPEEGLGRFEEAVISPRRRRIRKDALSRMKGINGVGPNFVDRAKSRARDGDEEA